MLSVVLLLHARCIKVRLLVGQYCTRPCPRTSLKWCAGTRWLRLRLWLVLVRVRVRMRVRVLWLWLWLWLVLQLVVWLVVMVVVVGGCRGSSLGLHSIHHLSASNVELLVSTN